MKHPAVFSDSVLAVIAEVIDDYCPRGPVRLLDPFAGTGKVHKLADGRVTTLGVELEPEWASMDERTLVGDARTLPPRWAKTFHVVATSPAYGNRMADHHENRDKCTHKVRRAGEVISYKLRACPKCKGTGISPRRSYTHDLGRPLSSNNAGAMQWGDEYRELHEAAWRQVHKVLRARGVFVLNIKDHVRDKRRVHVSAWHRRTIEAIGFERLETISIPLPGMRFGENHEARIPNEFVYVFRKVGR